jgi:hypothetical protein
MTQPVPPKHGVFITVGVRGGHQGKKDIQRAADTLQREGFRVGVTSDEAVVAMAQAIQMRQAISGEEPPQT